jgi:hypothetical protein
VPEFRFPFFLGIAERPAWDDFILGQTKPDAFNTGVASSLMTGTLTGQSGGVYTVASGSKIYRKRIEAHVSMSGNASLVECEVVGPAFTSNSYYPGFSGMIECSGTGNVIERTRISPQFPMYYQNGIHGTGFTARRCDISRCGDGINTKPSNAMVIEGCWLHDLAAWDGNNGQSGDGFLTGGNGTDHSGDSRFPGWEHNDCIQVYGGTVTIRGCNIQAFIAPDVGTPTTLTTTGNPFGTNAGRKFPLGNWNHGVFFGPENAAITATMTQNWIDGGEVLVQTSPQGSGFDTGNSFTFNYNRMGLGVKPGFTGNPTNPYTIVDSDNSMGTHTWRGNVFDPDASTVPAGHKGELIDAYFSSGQCSVTL